MPKSTQRISEKQKQFALEYIIDFHGTNAAIRAGYSPPSAAAQSTALLKNQKVKDAIAEAMAERKRETKIDANWVLSKLGEMFDADIADIMTETGSFKPVKEWPPVWRKMLNAIDVRDLYDGGRKVGEVLKVKFIDRLKALDMIGKHINVGAFSEKHEITGPIKLVFGKEDAEL